MINFSVIGTLAYWLFSQIACWTAQVNGQDTVFKSVCLDGRVTLTVFRICGAEAVVTLTEEQLLEEGPISCGFVTCPPWRHFCINEHEIIHAYLPYIYIYSCNVRKRLHL